MYLVTFHHWLLCWKKKKKSTQDTEEANHQVIVRSAVISTMAALRWFIQSCRCDECGPFLGQWAACHTAALNREQRGEAIAFKHTHTHNTRIEVSTQHSNADTNCISSQRSSSLNVSTLQSFKSCSLDPVSSFCVIYNTGRFHNLTDTCWLWCCTCWQCEFVSRFPDHLQSFVSCTTPPHDTSQRMLFLFIFYLLKLL